MKKAEEFEAGYKLVVEAVDSLTRVMDMCNRLRLSNSELQKETEKKLLGLISAL